MGRTKTSGEDVGVGLLGELATGSNDEDDVAVVVTAVGGAGLQVDVEGARKQKRGTVTYIYHHVIATIRFVANNTSSRHVHRHDTRTSIRSEENTRLNCTRTSNSSTTRRVSSTRTSSASRSSASHRSKTVNATLITQSPWSAHHAPPDLEWRLIYVSSPGKPELDQELDDCLVGPVPVGVNSFEFEGSAPSSHKVPPEDVLGVAALILIGSYNDQEFVRVGYYQNTEYDNEEMRESPPERIAFERLARDINTKPRVTRFQIKWSVITFVSTSVLMLCLGTYPHLHRVLQPLVPLHPLRCPRQTTWRVQTRTLMCTRPPKQTASHNHVVVFAELLITRIPLSHYMTRKTISTFGLQIVDILLRSSCRRLAPVQQYVGRRVFTSAIDRRQLFLWEYRHLVIIEFIPIFIVIVELVFGGRGLPGCSSARWFGFLEHALLREANIMAGIGLCTLVCHDG